MRHFSRTISQIIETVPNHYNSKTETVLTMDTDWACDEVLYEVLEMIPNTIKATIFATNASPVLKLYEEKGHEIAIHPNFAANSTQGSEPSEIIAHLLEMFPLAKGSRSHGLFQSSNIMLTIKKADLIYDSSILLYKQDNIHPFIDWMRLIRVPYFWEDSANLVQDNLPNPEELKNLIKGPGLKIFNFHPMLIALNEGAQKQSAYQDLKAQHPDLLKLNTKRINPFRQDGYGARALFQHMIGLNFQSEVE